MHGRLIGSAFATAPVVCLTLAKWETVSGRFGGYLSGKSRGPMKKAPGCAPGLGFQTGGVGDGGQSGSYRSFSVRPHIRGTRNGMPSATAAIAKVNALSMVPSFDLAWRI